MPEYVEVAVPVGVRKTFTYSVPAELGSGVSIGSRVLVPFGRKLLTGIVVGNPTKPPDGFKIRPVRELLDTSPAIPTSLIRTALWVANRYFTAPGEVLGALFPSGTQVSADVRIKLGSRSHILLQGGLHPPGISVRELDLLEVLMREGPLNVRDLKSRCGLRDVGRSIELLLAEKWVEREEHLTRARIAQKEQLGIRLLSSDRERIEQLTEHQRMLLAQLEPGQPAIPLQQFLRRAGSTANVAKALAARGLVEIAPLVMERIPIDLADTPAKKVLTLTAPQSRVFEVLSRMIKNQRPERCLLHGVTGSGKTEIYLRLIAEVLATGGSAMLLVPEIGLTPLLSRIALSHFPEKVALLHSGMSQGERFDQWHRIRARAAPVVVGTRSAVFAPLENLRLVVIDEEQDSSYKQDETPCYHAREVAWHRIQQSGGILLLGSATPSIETYHAAREAADMTYLSLPERVEAKPMPEVSIVDMSLEFQRHGRRTIVAQALLEELRSGLNRGEQSMVLLNRRGYSRSLLCRSCGQSFICSECSISMTYHQDRNLLVCHYCGAEKGIPSSCGNCGGEYIYFVGVGTEQLEEVLRALLPNARIARLDRDTTRRRGQLRKTLLDFSAGRIDLLVGTQMLAKGHDFPNVTLVGVVAADAGLQFPDFRSAERTFQLLTQVAGRAGRGSMPGRVIIQSFYPDHYALRFARMQDYAGFYRHEVEFRKLLGYPPFTSLVQILVSESSAPKAFQIGEKIATALKSSSVREHAQGKLRVLGPASAPLEKLRGKYRVQVLIKTSPDGDALPVLRAAFQNLGERRVPLKGIHVDVDPLSML